MAISKICGIETEYGILIRGVGESNPIAASSLLINAYLQETRRADAPAAVPNVGWDFEDESPGNDARGSSPAGSMPPEVETHLVNAVLTNGARYYVDHAHPELSTPECADARSVVVFDRAAELILDRLDAGGQAAAARGPGDRRLQEQLRRQGQQLRLPRELPDGAPGAVRPDRHPRDAALHHPPDLHRRRQGRAARPAPTARARCRSSSRSGPTSSRRRSGSRPRSSGRSSTRATSRTATPPSTGGCT